MKQLELDELLAQHRQLAQQLETLVTPRADSTNVYEIQSQLAEAKAHSKVRAPNRKTEQAAMLWVGLSGIHPAHLFWSWAVRVRCRSSTDQAGCPAA